MASAFQPTSAARVGRQLEVDPLGDAVDRGDRQGPGSHHGGVVTRPPHDPPAAVDERRLDGLDQKSLDQDR